MALGKDEKFIDYLILDCPVSSGNDFMDEVFSQKEDEQGISASYMIFAGNIYTRLKLGFGFDQVDAYKWLEKTSTPVLITNSSIDDVNPPYMGEDMIEAIPHDMKELYTVDDYGHAKFPSVGQDEYKKVVSDFLEKY